MQNSNNTMYVFLSGSEYAGFFNRLCIAVGIQLIGLTPRLSQSRA